MATSFASIAASMELGPGWSSLSLSLSMSLRGCTSTSTSMCPPRGPPPSPCHTCFGTRDVRRRRRLTHQTDSVLVHSMGVIRCG